MKNQCFLLLFAVSGLIAGCCFTSTEGPPGGGTLISIRITSADSSDWFRAADTVILRRSDGIHFDQYFAENPTDSINGLPVMELGSTVIGSCDGATTTWIFEYGNGDEDTLKMVVGCKGRCDRANLESAFFNEKALDIGEGFLLKAVKTN